MAGPQKRFIPAPHLDRVPEAPQRLHHFSRGGVVGRMIARQEDRVWALAERALQWHSRVHPVRPCLVRRCRHHLPRPRRVTVTLCAGFAAQAAFLVLWAATSGRPGTGSGHALAAMSGLAMGLQSAAILSLAVTGVFTTAATATVMLLVRDLAERNATEAAERARFGGVVLALGAGAAAGGLLLVHARTYAPVIPLAATALVIATASIALRPERPIG